MTATIEVTPRTHPDPGVRSLICRGEDDSGAEFEIRLVHPEVPPVGNRPGKIVLHRDGCDDVEVTADALADGLLGAS